MGASLGILLWVSAQPGVSRALCRSETGDAEKGGETYAMTSTLNLQIHTTAAAALEWRPGYKPADWHIQGRSLWRGRTERGCHAGTLVSTRDLLHRGGLPRKQFFQVHQGPQGAQVGTRAIKVWPGSIYFSTREGGLVVGPLV